MTVESMSGRSRPLEAGAALPVLRAAVVGAVFASGDAGYDEARSVWNAMIDRRPLAIVRCRGVADVLRAVGFARDHGLPVSIRGGGHNVAGHAVGDGGVMVDLSAMRGVQVDPARRIARVEGGATWGDVDRETQVFGLATPGGLISETGVAGLTLSGGMGWLRSRHGLCIDNMVSAEVVMADGRLVRTSATENADLLWALKGGGGNFGVVTAFEFAVHPIGPNLMFCAPIYPIEAGDGPIRLWRDFLADKGDDVASLVEFSTIARDPSYPASAWGRRVYTLAAVHAGDAEEGERVLAPLRALAEPLVDLSGPLGYSELQKLFDTQTPFGRHRCYWKSHYLRGLPDSLIAAIVESNLTPPSPNTLSSIWQFGGAMARVPADATAFGDRSMPYMLSIDSVWTDAADDAANIAWTRDFWERMRPHAQGGRMYLNFPGLGEEGERLLRDSFGANYARLQAIKQRYDPANMFRFNPNVAPAA
ncbi:MAG: FAD-binding oxidoreductase [Alphaproteobacteria bacterium]